MRPGQLKTIALAAAALALTFAAAPHAKSQQNKAKPTPAQQQSTPSATAQSSATMDGMQMGENQQRTAQNSDNMQQEIAKNPDAAQAAHQAMSGHMSGGMSDDDDMHMDMGAHMHMTDLRPANAADQKRAAEIVATVRQSIAKYQDYQVALNDGFKIFGPNVKQKVYHFTNYRYAIKAQFEFDAEHPTSLLYRKTADGYELVGAMYTAPRRFTEAQLDERVPLSVARWHEHVNFCLPPRGSHIQDVNWKQFGLQGSIATEDACKAADGRWFPIVFGWMVHVYPFETDPAKVWAH